MLIHLLEEKALPIRKHQCQFWSTRAPSRTPRHTARKTDRRPALSAVGLLGPWLATVTKSYSSGLRGQGFLRLHSAVN